MQPDELLIMIGASFGFGVLAAWMSLLSLIQQHERKTKRPMNKFREMCGFVGTTKEAILEEGK